MTDDRAAVMAGKIGSFLEGEDTRDAGIALGMVLGMFILILEQSDDGISDGIDAIASDAKNFAMKIRNMRQ